MRFRQLILFAVIFILYSLQVKSQLIQIGEELVYDVSYAGISLGTVTVITEPNNSVAGTDTYKAKCLMKSNPGIPFVGLNVIFESWMDKSLAFSRKFVGHYEDKGTWTYQEILFNYQDKLIKEQKFIGKDRTYSNQISSKLKWSDGLSLFFLARKYASSKKNYKLPTFVSDTSFTNISFSDKIEYITSNYIKYPVRTKYVSGNLTFKGVYGLSGNYQGWFSDDEAAIPIKAKMNVIVGSVDIQLKSWKRQGWEPPKKI